MTEHFAEFGIIASVLEYPPILSSVREALDPSDFLSEKHRVVWRSICELDDAGITPAWDALLQHISVAGDLHKVGGASGLAEMIDSVPRSDDVSGLIRQVKKLATDHRIAAMWELARLDLDDGEQPSEVLARYLPELAELQQRATEGRKPRFELIHASELDRLPQSEFLPGTHLVRDGLQMWYGLSQSGKSLKAMDDAYHLATLGPVVYVSAEGTGGLKKRRDAIVEHYRLDLGQIHFIKEPVNLLDRGEVSAFIADVKAKYPDGVLLVIFDTKSQCSAGGEENSSKDDSLQVAHSNRIRRELGCAEVLLHHSDKLDTTARGSGATHNACDVVLYFKRDDELVTISVTHPRGKLRDGEPWPDEQFRFVQSADSVVLLPSDQVAIEYTTKLTPQLTKILQALTLTVFEDGATQKQIFSQTGIPESSMFRLLSTLKDCGFISQPVKRAKYKLEEKGRAVLSNSQGALNKLSESCPNYFSNSHTSRDVRVESRGESESESAPENLDSVTLIERPNNLEPLQVAGAEGEPQVYALTAEPEPEARAIEPQSGRATL